MVVMSSSPVDVIDQLEWHTDRVMSGDLVLRLEHFKDDDSWELGDECLTFFKVRKLVDEYRTLFVSRPQLAPTNVLELGIWDGGSIAFWFDVFQPQRHVAIDIAKRGDSDYFTRYVEKRGLHDRIHTVWGVDQSDRAGLAELVAKEFTGPLDLVIDDASHHYGPTKASFEALFPYVREGGLYMIEDWAWGHWPSFHPPNPMSKNEPPTRLVVDIVQAAGTSSAAIRTVHVCEGFIAIERGDAELDGATFALDDHICMLPSGAGLKTRWSRGPFRRTNPFRRRPTPRKGHL